MGNEEAIMDSPSAARDSRLRVLTDNYPRQIADNFIKIKIAKITGLLFYSQIVVLGAFQAV